MTQVEQGENPPPIRPRVRRIDNPLAVLRSHWSYHDVLWLGLAGLPEGMNRLTADSIRWQEAVAQIKDSLSEVDPILFSRVHFDRRPGGPVYSDEVQRFTASLVPAFWRLRGNSFDIPEVVKAEEKAQLQDKLAGHQEAIGQVSQQLQSLAVLQ